jgi:PKD repeat protein
MLAAVSVSAFAAAPDAPNFLMHQASVNLKVSNQEGLDLKIDKKTIKTKEVINVLMGRSPDAKNEKDEKLGLVTGCDKDVDAAALVVYDKKLEIVKPLSDAIIIFVRSEVVETKDGKLKKVDLLGEAFEDEGFINVTGQIKYGKIGNKVAKDGDDKDHWNKDANCPRKFGSKSVTGVGFIGGELFIGGDVVMSGKINAGKAKFAFDEPISRPSIFIEKDNGIADDILPGPGTIEYVITVRNTGDVTLTNVTVEDEFFDGVDTHLICGDDLDGDLIGDFNGTLAVGEDVVCKGDRFVDEEEFALLCLAEEGLGDGFIRNVAVANSDQTDPLATENITFLDCDILVPVDAMSIAKAVTGIESPDGSDGGNRVTEVDDVINYAIDVTNIASQQLTNVQVTDTNITLTCAGGLFDGVLDPGETVTCTGSDTVTQAAIDDACGGDATIGNIATATADGANSISANAFVDVDCFGPPGAGDAMSIFKVADRTTAGIGDTINYDIEVQNIGNVQLTEVVVTDTPFPVDCVNFNGILNPDQVVNCHVIWVVTAEDVATACSRGGNIRNVAMVTSTQTDSFAADEFVGVACP